jgi:histidyl-tRNA synthetase
MPRKKAQKQVPTSLKGMRDIFEPEYFAYQGLFEKASEIAHYYGFKPIELPILEQEELFTTSIGEGTDILDKEMYSLKTKGGHHLAMRPEGTAGVMRAYIEHGMQSQPQPVMLYYYGPFFRHENPQRGRYREFRQFGLEILGTQKSVADATVIRLLLTILEEAGFKNLIVRINSIGDKESRTAYTKELVSYYKKNLENVCANCRQRIKTNPLRMLDCKNEKCHITKQDAPDSISSLNTSSKKHFKEVLEYLDAMSIIYEIDNNLVRGLDYYTQTVFEIVDQSEALNPSDATESEENTEEPGAESTPAQPLTLAGGGRYDYLAKQLGHKKDVSAVGASIGFDRVINSPSHKPIDPRIIKKPKVYFIQLGFEAKLKSLTVIEVLRKARIPVMHSLAKDRLSAQLAVAEKLQIPHTIILGQREALDNTVIIRNMNNRSQETVKIDNLAEYIKKKLK